MTTELSHRAAIDPDKTARKILVVLRIAKGDLGAAAKALGVGRTSLDRLIARLAIADRVEAVRKDVGWYERGVDPEEMRARGRLGGRRKGSRLTEEHKARIRAGVLRAKRLKSRG